MTGFRPFFLLALAHALIAIGLWAAMLGGVLPTGLNRSVLWHAHEMLYGFAPAVVAGFLLTAVPHWTGTRSLGGWPLAGLAVLWLLGRIGAWNGATPPSPFGPAELLALAFLPVLAATVAVPILRTRNRRNYGIPALVLALFAGQLLFLVGHRPAQAGTLTLDAYLVLMLVIGGRITPLFTRNALQRAGRRSDDIGAPAGLDRIALAAVLATLALAHLDAPLRWVAIAALAAGALQLVRLPFWQGHRALADPLVAVLHLGHAWIAATFLLRGYALLDPGIPNRAWIHAAGIGAMGTLILGVMTRVTLGHTGRPLVVPRTAWLALAAITAAALARVGVAVTLLPRSPWLELSAAAWVLAFALFGLFCTGKLLTERVDGRPG
ncbi:NnrS family protein [Wenzhouxiangella sp. XN79A]|uniref:NnrS family protein n=1 Tax=Wenzhouxiangella sp. XN79A TaxID=2724193 RepID=UPI00144A98F1|nr:NnrS family protein [Wenzhouxiangella sp. XN79A]